MSGDAGTPGTRAGDGSMTPGGDSGEGQDTLIEFPCEFPVKMMGRDTPEFRATVLALVELHTGPLEPERVQVAQSRNGRFVSVTVTVNAESKEQLDAIYRELTAHDDVLMAL
jgi:putative lipoic acid-binding regulatory protein